MKLLLRATLLACVLAGITAASATARPTIFFSCPPDPDGCSSGWYREPVNVEWDWVPTNAQVEAGCTDDPVDSDTTGVTRYCRVRDPQDGVAVTIEVTLKVDMTAPLVTGAKAGRPADGNGWYRSEVPVTFAGNDPTSGIAACTATTYAGPDSAAARVMGVCRDRAGNTSPESSFALKFDSTPPTIDGITPTRAPDHDSWYTRAVGFSVTAHDTLSGFAGCDPLAYDGPASAAAVVQPICRDVAGNAAVRAFTIPFDAAPPALRKVKVRPGDGVVRLNWAAADASKVRVVRKPGRNGDEQTELHDGTGDRLIDTRVQNGKRYEYRFSAVDQAGNEASRTLKVVPGPRLVSPSRHAQVARPPMLRWTPVRGADYYNVQLWRGSKKVLSTWPSEAKLKLKRRWRSLGKQRRLRAGEYRWIVWPGKGARALNQYGSLIGRRTFVFVPSE